MSDWVTGERVSVAGPRDGAGRDLPGLIASNPRQPEVRVRFGVRLASLVLVLVGPLWLGCGGSSSSTNATASGGVPATAGRGGQEPSAGSGGKQNGGDASGVPEGGEKNGAIPSTGGALVGDGGATSSDEPRLGGACESAGALACAGAHQKLTLVCSAGGKWEANQTCPSGQFCSSTPGPDLGICKAPEADCAERQPGDAFCASDAITLMQCDTDGIAATRVQQCDARCVDGQCAAALPCPENIVYSCDPACPGPSSNPSCFELCPTPASGTSPLLELSKVANGIKYAIALPAVAPNSQPCTCAEAGGALQGVVFRVPSPPGGSLWRFTYPKSWEFHSLQGGPGEMSDHYKACIRKWPFYLSSTPGCATVQLDATPPMVWLSANGPVAEPGTLFVELLPAAEATCPP